MDGAYQTKDQWKMQNASKNKFGRLSNAWKRTGDPFCATNTRRTKRIAQDIPVKSHSISLGTGDTVDDVATDATDVEGSNFLG